MNEQFEKLKACVNKVRTCATCDWGLRDELKDLICVNSSSHKCSDWVEEDYLCPLWEKRRRGRKK